MKLNGFAASAEKNDTNSYKHPVSEDTKVTVKVAAGSLKTANSVGMDGEKESTSST